MRTLHEGGDNVRQRLVAGPASYGEVTLRRGMTASFDLWDWCGLVARDPGVRADATVVLLEPDGEAERARFLLHRCLPVRLRAPRLDAVDGVVAIEELRLACEALTLDRPGRKPPAGPEAKAELFEPPEHRRGAAAPRRRAVQPGAPAGHPRARTAARRCASGSTSTRARTATCGACTEPIAALAGAPARGVPLGHLQLRRADRRRSRRSSTCSPPTAGRCARRCAFTLLEGQPTRRAPYVALAPVRAGARVLDHAARRRGRDDRRRARGDADVRRPPEPSVSKKTRSPGWMPRGRRRRPCRPGRTSSAAARCRRTGRPRPSARSSRTRPGRCPPTRTACRSARAPQR